MTTDEVMCEMYPNEPVEVHITYGLYSEYKKGRPHYQHDLSVKAAMELWEKCSNLVNQGEMHWSNKQITSETAQGGLQL